MAALALSLNEQVCLVHVLACNLDVALQLMHVGFAGAEMGVCCH